jgi:hypothetical protein
MTNEIVISKRFESKNNEVRAYYLEKLETEHELGIRIDELVKIVKEEHNDWSLTRIAQYICTFNDDLDGFSSQLIYDKISEENKILYGHKTKVARKLQNNVMEQEIVDQQSNVLEHSSISSFTFDYDLEVRAEILPLQVIVYPDRQTGVVRLRKQR